MKLSFLSVILLAAFCLAGTAVMAKNPSGPQAPKHNYKSLGGCNAPADQVDLDVNNVRTRLLDAGDQWWDPGNTSHGLYEVPKGDATSTTASPEAIYAGAIWVSALDQGNNLKLAALEYRTGGNSDYYTGPLDDNGNVSLATCNLWDQHFKVYSTDIKPCILAYQTSTNHQVPGTIVSTPGDSNMIRWPGKGNPYLAALGYNMGGVLAPFYDANGDGIYNPTDGDYPTIKQNGIRPPNVDPLHPKCDSLVYGNGSAYADEMIFWVMNDEGNVHSASNGSPIGIQVNELAFAFQSTDEINQMTFYTYNIINKSGAILHDTYMSQWTDVDLGCGLNDRVGCDTSRSMAIQYNGYLSGAPQQNGVSCDEGSIACPTGEVGYGCNLPMLGIKYFEGPSDTAIDPSTHLPKKLGMTNFWYFTNNAPTCCQDPTTASGFRNYQTGFWNDGTPWSYGGSGYGGSIPVHFCFPGDPSISTQWSECNPQTGSPILANDRRFVQTSGPFTFLPCASEIITIGVVFVDPTGGVGSNCPSFSFLYTAADKAQALFDAGFQQLSGPSAPLLTLRGMDQKVIIQITDDPEGNNVGESYAQLDQLRVSKGFISGTGEDSIYRFQGYILYQLSGPSVSSADLTDPTKAIPVVEYDIQDNVSHLVNYTAYSDPITGTSTWINDAQTIPGVGNNLANLGIQHSLVDSLDLIGGGALVNHMTYYFGVLSFATNNFAKFDASTGVGQSQPFLIGKNFNTYSVIPENSEATDGGRILNSSYGSSSQVKRIEGQGNGGNYIDLDAPTIVGILNSPVNYLDTLDYVVGQDPLALKVTDPVLLKEADFELVIYDTVPYNSSNVVSVSPNAWWVLTDLTNNVTIPSTSNLSRPYEQIIADALGNDYGFSLTLGTPFPVYTNYADNLPIYAPIGGTITFADPSHPWLSFVKDSGLTIANHWIRSGTYSDLCSGTTPDINCNVFSSAYYTNPLDPDPKVTLTNAGLQDPGDATHPNGYFNTIAGATWAPYCLAANFSLGPGQSPRTNSGNTAYEPLSVGGPAFKWDSYTDKAASPENTLDQLQSVDIVLTSDRSKWSQCVVFETGDNPVLDNPQAPDGSTTPPRKGMLRNHQNLNLQDSSYDQTSGNVGLSWFPGYAINVETGQRLDIGFGEASDEGDQNGRDMIWNPTSTLFGNAEIVGSDVPYTPLFGGRHYIYVFNTVYGNYNQLQTDLVSTYYGTMVNNPVNNPYSLQIRADYKTIMWTAMPYLTPGYSLKSYADGLIPNDVTIRLRMNRPYNIFSPTADPDTTIFAKYTFSTKGLGAKTNVDSVAKAALDMIRIVPNPYLAYSAYETSANDAEVKVTNLPNNCTIKIYTLDGVLVRTLSQSLNKDPITNKQIEITNGYPLNGAETVLDNSIEWNLKNESAIPISSGIYLFDINVPGVGHKILKWFGAVRPTDVSNF